MAWVHNIRTTVQLFPFSVREKYFKPILGQVSKKNNKFSVDSTSSLFLR